VPADDRLDCAGEVGSEALRFGYEGIAGCHSDRR
jgi:hypothetical protein